MLRGYRGILIAFVGLALLGAQPPKEDRGQPTQPPSQQIETPVRAIASALGKANGPSELEEPCKEGDDQRSSDLCAQWKAADAARSAANATWLFGTLGTLIGGLTLAAAYSAAKWARRAAEAGRDANKITLNAQRAWLSLDIEPQLVRPYKGGLYFRINIITKNIGATVATNFAIRDDVVFEKKGETSKDFKKRMESMVAGWREKNKAPGEYVIVPGDIDTQPYWNSKEASDFETEVILDRVRVASPIYVAAAFYRTATEPDKLQTCWRAWWINSIEEDGEPFSCLRVDSRLGSDRLHVIPRLSMVHEETEAT